MHTHIKIDISPKLHIRGVIAEQNIKKNTIIEKCPIILIDIKDEQLIKQTVLKKYYYEWTKKNHIIALGYGSLYNHSYKPNAKYYFDYKNKLLVFMSIKSIKIDEEITVNYNWNPNSKTPLETFLTDFNSHFTTKN